VADVALFYGERSGGIRTYLEARPALRAAGVELGRVPAGRSEHDTTSGAKDLGVAGIPDAPGGSGMPATLDLQDVYFLLRSVLTLPAGQHDGCAAMRAHRPRLQ